LCFYLYKICIGAVGEPEKGWGAGISSILTAEFAEVRRES